MSPRTLLRLPWCYAVVIGGVFALCAGAPFAHAIISNGANAIDGLGQLDGIFPNPGPVYTKGLANDVPDSWGINGTYDATVDTTHDRLFLADFTNNRVLVYNLNADSSLPDRIADNVIGQPNFYTDRKSVV